LNTHRVHNRGELLLHVVKPVVEHLHHLLGLEFLLSGWSHPRCRRGGRRSWHRGRSGTHRSRIYRRGTTSHHGRIGRGRSCGCRGISRRIYRRCTTCGGRINGGTGDESGFFKSRFCKRN
jgi:hypothetical protein